MRSVRRIKAVTVSFHNVPASLILTSADYLRMGVVKPQNRVPAIGFYHGVHYILTKITVPVITNSVMFLSLPHSNDQTVSFRS